LRPIVAELRPFIPDVDDERLPCRCRSDFMSVPDPQRTTAALRPGHANGTTLSFHMD